MARRWSLEIKVGAFVVLGLVLLIVFIAAIGDWSMVFQPGYRLLVVFDSANGIIAGSPVQYAGCKVGKVEQVNIIEPAGPLSIPKIRVIMWLPESIQVYSDDEASISVSTFALGEKFLSITPGPRQGRLLGPNEEMAGQPPVSIEVTIQRSNEVLTEFKQTLEGLNSLVGDPEARIYLKEALLEARDATRNWKAFGERLNLAMSHAESGEGNLGKFLYDDELYQQAIEFMQDLRAHPWKLLAQPRKQKSAK